MNSNSIFLYFMLLLLFILPLKDTSLTAQTPTIGWQKVLGGNDSDIPNVIEQTSDGGYIVVGSTSSSNTGDVGKNHSHDILLSGLTSLNPTDYWVIKLDTKGIVQWQKLLGGINFDDARSICQTKDGGYIVAGYTSSSNTGDVGSLHNIFDRDYWIVKLNGNGDIQWQKVLGGNNSDEAYSIQQTTDGGYIIAGDVVSSNSGDVGTNNGSHDSWIVKLDIDGNIQWQKVLGGNNDDYAYSIRQTNDGGYIVGGITNSSNSGDVGINHGKFDYWIVKLGTNGSIQWQKVLGGNDDETGGRVEQTSDGGYIVAGTTHSSNNGDVGINHGSDDGWIVKLDALGNIQWQKTLGGNSLDNVQSVKQTKDGGYIIAAYTVTSNNGDVGINHGGYDSWIVKLDNRGNIQWQEVLGGNKSEIANAIEQTSDGGYIIAGSTSSSNNGNVGSNHGSDDFWIVKLDPICTLQPFVVGNDSICKNATTQLLGSSTTGLAIWSSMDTSVATVSSSGLVSAKKIGTVNINYMVTEGSCSSITTKNVTVVDIPMIQMIGIDTNYCNNISDVPLIGNPMGGSFKIDNVSATNFNPSTLKAGSHSISYSYINTNGCTSTTNQIFTVNSPIPIFTNCPPNIVVTAAMGQLSANATWPAPSANVTCGVVTPTVTSTHNSGSAFDLGTTTVTYTAKIGIQTAICSFTVTVKAAIVNNKYCDSKSNQPWQEWLSLVQFNTIKNSSDKIIGSTFGYSDFTNLQTTINKGQSYPLSITPEVSWYGRLPNVYCRVWIDFNGNKIFEDNEKVLEGQNKNPFTATVQIPTNAQLGLTRMRISLKSGGYPTACENYELGEVEDYSILIAGTVVDACLNDVIPPVISNCPQNINLTTSGMTAIASWNSPTAKDNCAVQTLSSNYASGAAFPIGNTTVTYTAKDSRNNVSSCSFLVSVGKQGIPVGLDIGLSITTNLTSYKQFSPITYHIVAKNNGAQTATNVKIEFRFPENTVTGGTAISSIGKWEEYCVGSVHCYQWTIPSIEVGVIAILDIPVFILNQVGVLTAKTSLLSVTPSDSNISNNQASISINGTQQSVVSQSLLQKKISQYIPVVVEKIAPNPANDELTLFVQSLDEREVIFLISDAIGTTIRQEKRQVKKDLNQLEIDINDLPQGIYFIIPMTIHLGKGMPVKFIKI